MADIRHIQKESQINQEDRITPVFYSTDSNIKQLSNGIFEHE